MTFVNQKLEEMQKPEKGLAEKNEEVGTRKFRIGKVESMEGLRRRLSDRIVGQPDAVEAIVRALSIASAGLHDEHRPIASMLFVGPTGVGKTELARQLAKEISGDEDDLCRIDMNALAQEHYSASLTGAPPGYSGAKEKLSLFDRDRIEGNISKPSVVLFDEVEKAHQTVIRALLHVLDAGKLKLASGNEEIDFRNAVVIFTSNLGARSIVDSVGRLNAGRVRGNPFWNGFLRKIDRKDKEDPVIKEVKAFFDPEFFNRFDEVIRFSALDKATAQKIAEREFASLSDRLRKQDLDLQFDPRVIDFVVERGFDPAFGARNLKRVMRIDVMAPIAERIVGQGSSWDGNNTTIKLEIWSEGIQATLR